MRLLPLALARIIFAAAILLATYLNARTAFSRSPPVTEAPSLPPRRIVGLARHHSCTLEDVGLGRWTYNHTYRKEGQKEYNEAIEGTGRWTPLRCSLPRMDWHPNEVLGCFTRKNIRKFVIMGGSTSRYIMIDFKRWMQGQKEGDNEHTKVSPGTFSLGDVEMKEIHIETANVTAFRPFLQDEKYFENTLVLFNSGLWDMRANDLDQYAQNVEELAGAFSQYKEDHPTNRVVWRTSGTPNWDRLDLNYGRIRAKERLLNADAVLTYNTVASEAMKAHGVEIFDNALMVLGRPEETRGPRDGLHPSTRLNIELLNIFFSVLCAE